MPLQRRQFSSRPESVGFSPAEIWLGVQAVVLVVFSAWAFGGAVAWAQNIILGLALAGVPILWIRARETGAFPVRPLLPALLWLGFNAIAAFNPSHVPQPGGGWAERPGWIAWLPATVDVAHTLDDARVWLGALVVGGLVVALRPGGRIVRLIWGAVALNGFVLAATGAFFQFAGAERVLGQFEPPEPTYFFATFFYKNHWAAYGALVAVAGTALSLRAWPAALAGDPRARGRAALFGAAGLLTAVTLPLPGSRAGALMAVAIIAGYLGLLAAGWWRAARGDRPRRRWEIGFGAVVAAGIVAFGVQSYAPRAAVDVQRTHRQLKRHLDGEALDTRVLVSGDTWRMACARPWFGWGPGSFEVVFPIFQGNYLRGPDGRPQARFEFAHNDWLQLPAEAGFVGALFVLVPAALLAVRSWRRASLVGRWALGGCGLIAAHGWIDFPFHNPAVLLLWVLLLGTARRMAPAANDDDDDRPMRAGSSAQPASVR